MLCVPRIYPHPCHCYTWCTAYEQMNYSLSLGRLDSVSFQWRSKLFSRITPSSCWQNNWGIYLWSPLCCCGRTTTNAKLPIYEVVVIVMAIVIKLLSRSKLLVECMLNVLGKLACFVVCDWQHEYQVWFGRNRGICQDLGDPSYPVIELRTFWDLR